MKKFNLELKVTPYKNGLKKDAIPYKYAAVPQGMYMLRNYLNKNEYAIIEFLFTMHDLKSGNKPKEFIKSKIIDHMMIDKDNFNKSFNLLKEKKFIFELESKVIINVDLIIQKINEHGFDWKKLNDPTKEAIQLESDLKRYEDLKFIIDNGIGTDKHKADFATLSDKLGYSNNNTLENNFNNTKTEDYVTTIRTDNNTINTSDDSIDNHISSNEKETEEDIFGEDGEDGFGEDRIDDIQKKIENVIEVIEDTSNDINKYKNLNLELLDYRIPNYEDTSNDIEVDNKEEIKTKEMITQETVDLFNELLQLTEGVDINSKKESIRIKISDWKRRNEKNYSDVYYRDIALNQFLKEEIENLKIYNTVPDVEEVKEIEDYSFEETKIRNSNDSYAEALKILINRYSNDELNEEEITKEYNSFFGVFYEKKSLNDVLFVYEQVRGKYNKKAA